MTQSVADLENTFARAWTLLMRNWIIIIPPLAFGLLGGFLIYVAMMLLDSFVLTGSGNATVGAVSEAVRTIVEVLIGMSIAIVQMAFVTGMAGAAWQHGRTTLRDGWHAVAHRGLQMAIAIALLFLIGLCATALAPVTFWISLVAYMVFFIYTMASVIIGEREAIAAISESCQLTFSNFWPTVGIVVMIVIIAIVGGWVGTLVGRLSPLTGGIVAAVLQQVIVGYAVLVITGEYLKLREQAGA